VPHRSRKKISKKPRETETDTGCFRIKKYRRKNVWLKFQSADFLLECSAKYIMKSEKMNQNCEQLNRSHDEKKMKVKSLCPTLKSIV